MGMRRFVWIAIIGFGGGLAALMLASILIHRATRGAAVTDDLKTYVTRVRQAMTAWDYDKLTTVTSDIPHRLYQQMFDDANAGDPVRLSKFEGALSAMDTFPSVRFTDVKPERVDVHYEVVDGTSAARPGTSFVPRGDGYFLPVVRFPVTSTDTRPGSAIVFHEGDNIALPETVEKLFEALTRGSPDEFRTLMMLEPGLAAPEVTKRLDQTRALVMTYHDERLRKMIPRLGPLPRGTQWLRILVVAEVGEREKKRLWLDMTVVPGKTVRFGNFKAGLMKDRVPADEPGAK